MADGSDIGTNRPDREQGAADVPVEHSFECGRHLLRRRGARRRRLGRAARAVMMLGASLMIVTVVAGAYAFARLRQGPVAFDLKPQIVEALGGRIGRGYRFDFGATAIALTDAGPALTLDHLAVADASARPIVTAPQAAIAVDPLALLVGRIAPTRLDINDVDVSLVILPDGEVAVSAGSGDAAAVPLSRAFKGSAFAPPSSPANAPHDTAPGLPSPDTGNAALRAMAAAMRSLVDAATAAESPLNALQRVNVTGRLVLDDRSHGSKTTFKAAVLTFDRESDGAAVLSVAADGPAGRWTLKARAAAAVDGTRRLAVTASNLSLDEITLAGGLRDVGVDFDMPVSAKVDVALGADGTIDRIGGSYGLGSGYFRLEDPDYEPMLIDSVAGTFHLDRESQGVVLDTTTLKANGTMFSATGHVGMPRALDEPWRLNLVATGQFGAERPGEKPIPITRVSVDASLFPAAHRLSVDKAVVTGPDVDFNATATVQTVGDDIRIGTVASVRHMPAQVLARLWPSVIGAPVRAWVLANVRGGAIDYGTATATLDGADLKAIRSEHPAQDGHVHIEFGVSKLALGFMPGLPPLTDVDATGVVTGHTFDLKVGHGALEVSPGHRLSLIDGDFSIADTAPRPMPAKVVAHIGGGVDAVAALLSRDALKPYASLTLDSQTLHGALDGRLDLGLLIDKDAPATAPSISAAATLSDFGMDKIVGKEGLSDATLKLDFDKGAVHAKGEGRVLGAPATIDFTKPAQGAGTAALALTLDDAARARAGLTFGGAIKGAVGVKAEATVTPGEKTRATVDLDLAKATIDGPMPGYLKPAGKPAKATLTLLPRDAGTTLDGIVYEAAGGATLRGSAELDRDGALASAKLSEIRMSPGDDLKADVQQVGDVTRVVARGANLDARPFLKWLSAPAAGPASGESAAKGGLDLDLHVGVLTGQNSQAMTDADLRLGRRAGRLTRVAMAGRLGRAPFSVTTTPQDGAPHFIVRADDAGSTLLFLDLYKRMAGGRLDANLVMRGNRLDGVTTVHNFVLREDPAIRKLAVQSLTSQVREGMDSSSSGAPLDPSAMQFTKLEASFSKTGDDIEVRDGSMFGPALGATVAGHIDFARDRITLAGTFVPLFGVNNLFAQLPVLGPLLGGGPHEGLVGISYRISGSAANPVLSVNVLSALAPGFLRQIFGALDPTQASGSIGLRERSDPAPLRE